MNIFNNAKLLLVLKVVVFAAMTYYILHRLLSDSNIQQQFSLFLQSIKTAKFIYLLVVLLLMPINWLLETIKWKTLLKTNVSIIDLFKSVLAGVTLGFTTPARSGEFIGRLLYLTHENKAKIFYLSGIGGIAQASVTLLAGAVGIMMWSSNSLFNGMTVGVAVAFMLAYFRVDILNHLISSVKFFSINSVALSTNELPTLTTQWQVLALSFIRYFVYLGQYIAALLLFNTSESLLMLVVFTSVFLTIQSFSPVLPFLDISFRGGSILYVFNETDCNVIALLSVVTLVWIVNLVIPALAGYILILRKNITPKISL